MVFQLPYLIREFSVLENVMTKSMVEGVYSNKRLPFNAPAMSKEKRIFEERLEAVPEHLKEYVLKAYANPIISKREFALK